MKKIAFIALTCLFLFPVLSQNREEVNPNEAVSSTPAQPGSIFAPEAILYENGPLINSPGTGVGGADESVVQGSLSMTTLGFGHQVAFDNRVADDFLVPEPGWVIDTITFYAYQTGSSTTSTITAVNLQIWDAPPGTPTRALVWGDTVTNVLASSMWTGIYRVSETTTGQSSDRPIMANTVTVATHLPPGTYWLDWQSDGSLSSGPWAPPITINGVTTTGNGLQSLDAGVTFDPLVDGGTAAEQGLPFLISGVEYNPVPTMGYFALAAFVVLLLGAGLILMRKNRA